ncbi:hypothetical protein RJ639_020421 [Escallonia herrerae]|uniref:Alcohol dehydrogenase-like N-terminal domain-containing protein n=1 Tax=Escallonia herrerae TaxID=1293975 RepID=A0AA89AGU5_9ASTE|nr:hypothetical protein RJ639_020421 [Escallonia herrerae]
MRNKFGMFCRAMFVVPRYFSYSILIKVKSHIWSLHLFAAVAWGPRQPLVMEEILVEPPQKMEVRIKILFTSICQTDLTAWKGENEAQRVYPRIFGHEASGLVEAVAVALAALDLRPLLKDKPFSRERERPIERILSIFVTEITAIPAQFQGRFLPSFFEELPTLDEDKDFPGMDTGRDIVTEAVDNSASEFETGARLVTVVGAKELTEVKTFSLG